jgi:hypothetical protein
MRRTVLRRRHPLWPRCPPLGGHRGAFPAGSRECEASACSPCESEGPAVQPVRKRGPCRADRAKAVLLPCRSRECKVPCPADRAKAKAPCPADRDNARPRPCKSRESKVPGPTYRAKAMHPCPAARASAKPVPRRSREGGAAPPRQLAANAERHFLAARANAAGSCESRSLRLCRPSGRGTPLPCSSCEAAAPLPAARANAKPCLTFGTCDISPAQRDPPRAPCLAACER